MTAPVLAPETIDLVDSEGRFDARWPDGQRLLLGYRELRLACSCASCVHELTGELLLDPNTVSESIGVQDCQPVGHYGIRIQWSDGHDTGIYTWERLRKMVADSSDSSP